jgi:predicted short-subunit dehydrogenase-like oxidoreductase (DUF2520 family)
MVEKNSLIKLEKISFIGAGNVATHLAKNLCIHYELDYIYTKSGHSAQKLINEVGGKSAENINQLLSSDLVIIAVPDDEISEVVEEIGIRHNAMIVHTSGSTEAECLAPCSNNYGVLYPLQSFSKDLRLDIGNVPFLINANSQKGLTLLQKIVNNLGSTATLLSDEDRQKVHLAAVMVNNFSNHLYYQAYKYLETNGLGFEYLKPLILETMRKAFLLGPYASQTGPARRGDERTIQNHLAQLNDYPHLRHLYSEFTKLIQTTYENSKGTEP